MRRAFVFSAVAFGVVACVARTPPSNRGTDALYGFGCDEETICAAPATDCIRLSIDGSEKATVCSLDCFADSDCPDGRCVAMKSGKVCFRPCRTTADCGSGYCVDLSDGSLPGGPTTKTCWWAPPPRADCAVATSCGECTALVGCGYCKSSQICSTSNEDCPGFPASWTWDPAGCGS